MEMFFLRFVNEAMYLLCNLPFFKVVPPKTNIFSFLKPWADNSSKNQYSYQLFYGWGMTHLMPSYLKNVGETPSALRYLSYLIESESESRYQLCPTLCKPMDCPWSSLGQNTKVGSLSLLHRISPTQGSNPDLPYCWQILYQLRQKRSPRILE